MTNIQHLKQLIERRDGQPFTSRDFRGMNSVPTMLNKLCQRGFIIEHDTGEENPEGCKKVYIQAPRCAYPGLQDVFPEMFILRQPKGGRVFVCPKE